MEQITIQTIIEGGILITLIYIVGVLVKILRSTTKIEGDTGVIAAALPMEVHQKAAQASSQNISSSERLMYYHTI